MRITAFVRVRELALLSTAPSGGAALPLMEQCLKGTYLTYVRNAKFVSENTWHAIALRRNCVTELYSLDIDVAYQHAFVYIRQLAIQLRGALSKKTIEAVQGVYNWKFVTSLQLWTQLLCATTATALRQLVYPLAQLLRGTADLQPTPE